MTFKRKQVGKVTEYNGHKIIVRFCGPDLVCEVDGSELGAFYLDAEAARSAGRKHCDLIDKEKQKKQKGVA